MRGQEVGPIRGMEKSFADSLKAVRVVNSGEFGFCRRIRNAVSLFADQADETPSLPGPTLGQNCLIGDGLFHSGNSQV